MSDATLGTIRGQMILDVKQALASYTAVRQQHISTVTALSTGGAAIAQSGAMVAGAGVAMAAGFLTSINAAAEFERKLDYFIAVGGPGAADQYDAVAAKALQLGADTIYSADQIADSFVELAKSGVDARDIIDGIGEGVAALGAAADIPLDTAANIITSAVATFQLGAENAVMVADKLAGAANASIIDVQDLGVSLKYVGGVAASLGVPFQDVNTALAILGENGIKGSTAGTSLRQVLLGLNGSTKKAKVALRELGIITEDGANKFYTAEGKAKSLSEVFQILQEATAGMSDQQRTATMQQIFATRALPSLIALTREGADGFAAMAAEINKTTAFDVASQRLDNLSGDIEILRGNIDTLMITAGGPFQNFARTIVQGVTQIVQAFMDLEPAIQTTILIITAVSSAILVIVGFFGMFAGAILNIISLAIRMQPAWMALVKVFTILRGAIFAVFALMGKSPIGILITLITALVGALVWFFTQTQQGQAIFAQFIAIIQQLWAVAGPALTNLAAVAGGLLSGALQSLLPILSAVGNFLMSVIQPVLPIITQLLTGLSAAFAGVSTNASGLQGFLNIFAGITAGIINAIPVIITTLVQLITLILQTLVSALPMLITGAMQLFTGLILGLTAVLPQIIAGVTQMITQLLTALVSMLPMLITAALQLFTGIVQGLTLALPQIIMGLMQALVQIVQALIMAIPLLLQAAIQFFMAIVQAIPQVIPPLLEAIVTMIPTIITTIISLIPMLIEAAIQLFMAIVQAIPQIIPPLIEAIINLLPTLVTTVISLIPQLIQAAIQLFLAIVQAVPKIIGQLIPAIIGLIPTIVSTVLGLIPQLIQAAIQLFMGIVQAIPQVIPQLVSALIGMGRDLINGLAQGVRNAGSAVMNAIGGVVNGAIDWAKGLLGIKSPSRVFMGIGHFTMAGLVKGIENDRGLLQRTMTTVANDMIDFYDQVGAAKELEAQVAFADAAAGASFSLTTGVAAQLAELTRRMAEIAEKDTINVEKLEVNNPEPEPASDSLPNAIRKTSYMVG